MGTAVEKTLHELGNGVFAYTQLPGSWGWSNSGLVTDGGESLLVDTLFDEKITAEMLATMREATPAAKHIDRVVNTHGNGDHCYGNSLVADAQIIGTVGCLEELRDTPASRNQLLMRAGKVVQALGPVARVLGRVLDAVGIHKLRHLTEASELALPLFEEFDFSSETVLPDRTFRGELKVKVGDKEVVLMELGPAHTSGDAVVWVPGDKILFTGDILFKDAHPVIWQGPVSNWITGLHQLLQMDIETVVPGHGPLTDKSGLREILHYLEVLSGEARKRYDAGMSVEEAVLDIHLSEFDQWLDAERVYTNVHTLYRDFSGDGTQPDVLALFAGMSRMRKKMPKRN